MIWFALLLGATFTSPAVIGRAGTAAPVENSLTWDDTEKTAVVDEEVQFAEIAFTASNRGSSPVTIMAIRVSCGCMQVRAPTLPWTLKPGESEELVASINLAGKTGELEEKITVETDTDEQNLLVRIVRVEPFSPTERRGFNQRKKRVATAGGSPSREVTGVTPRD